MDTTKPGFQEYEQVRENVLKMLGEDGQSDVAAPSEYWQEELSGFDYMLEASPKLVNKLRHQSYHLTGLKHYEYRSSQVKRREAFRRKLAQLKNVDKTGLFVPEATILGGFGHDIDGDLVNIDTLKFYESLIALDKSGVLSQLKAEANPVIVEIGGGWGGFAYQTKKVLPKCTHITVDFPEVFLFSATYLMTAFPEAKTKFICSVSDSLKNHRDYDFVFLPQQLFNSLWDIPVDLGVNMVSFQEMTTEQVDNYARRLKASKAKVLYSHNRDRSSHNSQLTLVSEILQNHYDMMKVTVLNGSYTNLDAKLPKERQPVTPTPEVRLSMLYERGGCKTALKHLLGRLGGEKVPVVSKTSKNHWMDYQHLVGKLS